MRDYGRVAPTFWTGSTGRRLRGKPNLQVVAMYLFTSPNANMIGLYYLPLPIIAHETGLALGVVEDALVALRSLDVAKYDPENEIVFVPAMARFQIGETIPTSNRNLIKGIARELERFERHEFAHDFVARYAKSYHLTKPLRSPFEAPSKGSQGPVATPSKGESESPAPLRDQDQDQETDQEQEGAPPGSGPIEPPEQPARPDPLTPYGLITLVKAAVERAQPRLGLYNPGQWGYKSAQAFLDQVEPEKRNDITRAEIRARIETFAASTDQRITRGKWLVESFCENYALLGQQPQGPPSQIASGAAAAARRIAAGAIARYGQ